MEPDKKPLSEYQRWQRSRFTTRPPFEVVIKKSKDGQKPSREDPALAWSREYLKSLRK